MLEQQYDRANVYRMHNRMGQCSACGTVWQSYSVPNRAKHCPRRSVVGHINAGGTLRQSKSMPEAQCDRANLLEALGETANQC